MHQILDYSLPLNILDRCKSIAEGGSTRYQFRKFVVGQHETPEAQALQCALEAIAAASEIRRHRREIARAEIDLEEIGARVCWTSRARRRREIDREEKLDEIESSTESMAGRVARIGYALEMLAEIEEEHGEITRERLEASEPDRWSRRLDRQVALGIMDRATGAGAGNLDAIRQTGRISADEIRAVSDMIVGAGVLPGYRGAGEVRKILESAEPDRLTEIADAAVERCEVAADEDVATWAAKIADGVA